MRHICVLLTAILLWATPVSAQSVSAGGVFLPREDYVLNGQWQWNSQLTPWVIEGVTADAFEARITFGEPTADITITFFNATDTIVGLATTDTLTNKTLTSPTLTTPTLTTPTITNPTVTTELVTASGGTETLTSADCGQTVLMDSTSGSVITLPDAAGTGCWFRFVVTVTLSSGTHDIVLANAGDDMTGGVTNVNDILAEADSFFIVDGSDNDTISMDGNTEGGEAGSVIFIQDILSDIWFVHGALIGVGNTPTTPFLTNQVS